MKRKRTAIWLAIARRWMKDNYAVLILVLMIITHAIYFSILAIDRHNRFSSLAFDLGIYDQAIWQMSHGKPLFNTVRGIHIFADHITFINYIVVPFYWLWDDVRILLILQSAVIASAAIPVFLLARKYFGKGASMLLALVYLAYPTIHYLNLEDYHPEVFSIPLILFAFYFLSERKFKTYFVFLFITMLVKEEVVLSLILLGIYAYFAVDKKVGLATSASALLVFLLYIYVLLPSFGASYFRGSWVFGNFGSSPSEIFVNIINPAKLFPILFTQQNMVYFRDLFLPVGFVALFSPQTLIMSSALLINFISSWPYAHSIHYHHSASIVPFVFVSLVLGLKNIRGVISRYRFKKATGPRIAFLAAIIAIIAGAAVSLYYISPYDVKLENMQHVIDKLQNLNTRSEREMSIGKAIGMIPRDSSVSAHYAFVPHLTHRGTIYLFPNPFITHYWGNLSEEVPLEYVDHILVTTANEKEIHEKIVPLVSEGIYTLETSASDIMLYKKAR